ncbi:hypothetical protein Tco_0451051 [Tanacetum coccineum]
MGKKHGINDAIKVTLFDVIRKLSLMAGKEIITFNIGKSMKFASSHDDYLYVTDHTANLVQEEWTDTLNHDGKWIDIEEENDSKKCVDMASQLQGDGITTKFHYYIMEGFINGLQEIGNRISQSFRVMCKADDDLWSSSRDKTNKRNTHENDEQSSMRKARLVAFRIAVQHQALRKMNLKFHRRREKITEDEPEVLMDGF